VNVRDRRRRGLIGVIPFSMIAIPGRPAPSTEEAVAAKAARGAAEQQLAAAQAHKNSVLQQLQDALSGNAVTEGEAASLRSEVLLLRDHLASVEAEKAAETESARLREAQLQKDLAAAIAAREELQNNIEALQGSLNETQEELAGLTAAREKLQDDVEGLQRSLQEAQEKLGISMAAREKLQNDVEGLRRSLQEAEEKAREDAQRTASLKEEASRLQDLLGGREDESMRQCQSAQAQVTALSEESRRLQAKVQELEQQAAENNAAATGELLDLQRQLVKDRRSRAVLEEKLQVL